MKRLRLGLCMGNREYGKRFAGCLMNHYRDQLELHIILQEEALDEAAGMDAVLAADLSDAALERLLQKDVPLLYLHDGEREMGQYAGKGVFLVDKYQEVNKIVDEILKQIGEEIKQVGDGAVRPHMQVLAVYTLSESELQLPFAVTLASILSERERVLLLDLQENSGLSQLLDETYPTGLEELFVMAESGKYSKGRIVSCIGHLDRTDVVYPAANTECLCEVKSETYRKLFALLANEMDYTTVILNLGSRFMGFFELLGNCREIYLMKSRGGLGQWREREFYAELEKRGGEQAAGHLHEIQIPAAPPAVSCERLVEQWKWNEFGDSIRRMTAVG